MTEAAAPELAESIREARPEMRERLADLSVLVSSIADTEEHLAELRARRLERWRELSSEGVSWADLSRISGVADATIIQAVNGRKR